MKPDIDLNVLGDPTGGITPLPTLPYLSSGCSTNQALDPEEWTVGEMEVWLGRVCIISSSTGIIYWGKVWGKG